MARNETNRDEGNDAMNTKNKEARDHLINVLAGASWDCVSRQQDAIDAVTGAVDNLFSDGYWQGLASLLVDSGVHGMLWALASDVLACVPTGSDRYEVVEGYNKGRRYPMHASAWISAICGWAGLISEMAEEAIDAIAPMSRQRAFRQKVGA